MNRAASPPLDRIRLTSKARDQLITLKRYTGIKNWNVLCRWALCVSLAEPTPPSPVPLVLDSTVEMTWAVFAGRESGVYVALLRERVRRNGLTLGDDVLAEQFLLHLHRGISYLAGDRDRRSIAGLLGRAFGAGEVSP